MLALPSGVLNSGGAYHRCCGLHNISPTSASSSDDVNIVLVTRDWYACMTMLSFSAVRGAAPVLLLTTVVSRSTQNVTFRFALFLRVACDLAILAIYLPGTRVKDTHIRYLVPYIQDTRLRFHRGIIQSIHFL